MDESKRVVPYSKGQALADEFGIQFFETSAKSNLKVEEASILSTQEFLAIVPGMSWGTVEPVYIDHEQPYAGFDLHDDEQSKLYFHWTKLPHAPTAAFVLWCYMQVHFAMLHSMLHVWFIWQSFCSALCSTWIQASGQQSR